MPQKQPQYLYLTTTGRRSGKPREIEIWFTESDGRYYVIAEYADAKWVGNMRAKSDVTVRIADSTFKATGRVVNAATEREIHARVRKLSDQKYGWGDGLVVELATVTNK